MRDSPTQLQTLRDAAHAHFRRGEFADAERRIREALVLEPQSHELWTNMGVVQAAAKRFDAALGSLDRALYWKPDFANARATRANIYLTLGRYSDAIEDYRETLRSAPGHPYAIGNLIFCKLQCVDWSDLDALVARARSRMEAGERSITPALATALLGSAPELLRALRIVANDRCPSLPPIWRGEHYGHDRIRIAYVSSDFYAHATAVLMAGVFESHDRGRFETIAISLGRGDGSAMRARLERSVDRFLEVGERSDVEIANLMRQAEIDIAVDLKGYTSHARPRIFSFRPAPVQVNFLGFPATMAADFMDYIVGDRFTIPESDVPFFSEKVIRLPDSYQPNDRTRSSTGKVMSRAVAGLPETGFVFCCFNNSFKIQPQIFDVWMRLLRETSGSVLWLLADNPVAVTNLKREAVTRGIDSSRLVFAPRAGQDDHLARHRLADLFLDTLPYNAHTTASDALWSGLPLLTCMGGTFAGRVAASVLSSAGLPELVTSTMPDYEALALALARDHGRLAAIKVKLVQNRNTCSLFDAARFTRHLEDAYTLMRERSERGEKPAAFDVAGGA